MKQIAVGDHVRFLTGKEQGYVVNIRKNIIEVEIEDGFIIPVVEKELVVISSEEKKYFQGEEQIPASKNQIDGELFLAIQPLVHPLHELYIINQKNTAYFFTCYLQDTGEWRLLGNGALQPQTFTTLQKLKYDHFDRQVNIMISWMTLGKSTKVTPLPANKIIKLKSKWLAPKPNPLPLIVQNGHLIPLTGEETEEEDTKIDALALKNALLSNKEKSGLNEKPKLATKQQNVIDLHIENLVGDDQLPPKTEILSFQINYFEKILDEAIASGQDEITFIHGVGNGILKYNIEKKLSGHRHVATFKDAQKEKFGYGAVYVKFK